MKYKIVFLYDFLFCDPLIEMKMTACLHFLPNQQKWGSNSDQLYVTVKPWRSRARCCPDMLLIYPFFWIIPETTRWCVCLWLYFLSFLHITFQFLKNLRVSECRKTQNLQTCGFILQTGVRRQPTTAMSCFLWLLFPQGHHKIEIFGFF